MRSPTTSGVEALQRGSGVAHATFFEAYSMGAGGRTYAEKDHCALPSTLAPPLGTFTRSRFQPLTTSSAAAFAASTGLPLNQNLSFLEFELRRYSNALPASGENRYVCAYAL